MHGGVETFPVIYVIAAVNFVGDICCILEITTMMARRRLTERSVAGRLLVEYSSTFDQI